MRSTHTRTFPLLFGVTTIGAHHSVGSSTRDITPLRSILCNSRSVSFRSGIGTCRGTVIAKGVASCVTLISYSWSLICPRPVKRLGYFSLTLSFILLLFRASTQLSKFRLWAACLPNNDLSSPLTTNIFFCSCLVLVSQL